MYSGVQSKLFVSLEKFPLAFGLLRRISLSMGVPAFNVNEVAGS